MVFIVANRSGMEMCFGQPSMNLALGLERKRRLIGAARLEVAPAAGLVCQPKI